MGSMKGFGLAVVATLAPLLAVVTPELLAPSESKDTQHKVDCAANLKPEAVTVSVPDSTVVVQCQPDSTFDPKVVESAQDQEVYDNAECTSAKKRSTVCPSVSIKALKSGTKDSQTEGATLTVKQLPLKSQEVCFVRCKPTGQGRNADGCVVQVTVNKAAEGESGLQDQAGAPGQAGAVHICAQPGKSISLRVPDENSSVKFRCAEDFNLYPTEPKAIFKDDCKTVENLKDMTRTQPTATTSAVGTRVGEPITYTLRADKKPARKRLCYLCAKQAPSDKTAKPAENYCAIYVEASARTKLGLGLTLLAPMLPCVLAVLRLP